MPACAFSMPVAVMAETLFTCCAKAVRSSRWTWMQRRLTTFASYLLRYRRVCRPENFQVAPIDRLPLADGFADVVMCSSVLHFAQDEEHFRNMLAELWRVLRPGGMLFCRLGSRIGMDFERVGENIFVVGDGSKWFLVNEEMLMDLVEELNAVLVDPLKTTIVQDYRCMTTWVLRKRRG